LRGGVFDEMGEVDVGTTIGGVGDDSHHPEWQIGYPADLGNGSRFHIDGAGFRQSIQHTSARFLTCKELIATDKESFKDVGFFQTGRPF